MNIQQSSAGLYSRPSMDRSNGLRKLGVSEDDVILAEKLLEQISSCSINKAERILGYATTRMKREKATRLLGATEDEVAVEIPKVLGSLGVAGRRRSYSYSTTDITPPAFIQVTIPGVRSSSNPHAQRRFTVKHSRAQRRPSLSRSSTFDRSPRDVGVRRLRNQAKSSTFEIETLKEKIEMLEKRLAMVEHEKKSSCTTNGTSIPMLIENCDTHSNS
ncbi:hypothetical protein ACHAW5_001105 [Stephanodiscus triporus]|uniref:Uncharacterized protein n=1 Tax=Stephanodiscus triporus TaxID=2934178 RepID=A0ABD3PVV4_9STRA